MKLEPPRTASAVTVPGAGKTIVKIGLERKKSRDLGVLSEREIYQVNKNLRCCYCG